MDEEAETCPPRARDREGGREMGRTENERVNTSDASTRSNEMQVQEWKNVKNKRKLKFSAIIE